MYYVYILKSGKDNNLYIGFTADLRQRLEFHNQGFNQSTAKRRPLKLIYYEGYLSEKDARGRERFLKSGRGHEVLYKQLVESLKI
jgi:putative endonuclease